MNGFAIETREGKPFEPWEMALDEAGLTMQKFRQRWDLHGKSNPLCDYKRVGGHIINKDKKAAATSGASNFTAAPITVPPERAAFGLPLTFRYNSLKYKKRHTDTMILPPQITSSRAISSIGMLHPVLVRRMIKIKDKCYPLYIRLDAPLIEVKEEHGVAIGKPTGNILDTFCTNIKAIGSIT